MTNINKKTPLGLVFSGGGGKGSYQMGVIKALAALGMDTQVKAVSGASIGAVNAALFSAGDYEKGEMTWMSIKPSMFLSFKTQEEKSNDPEIQGAGFLNKIKNQGIFSREGLIQLLDATIDLAAVSESLVLTFANAAKGEGAKTECDYFLLNKKSTEEIRQIILASTALPFMYEPVIIDGIPYRDGGIKDNIPVKPLIDEGLEHIITVRLEPKEQINAAFQNQADYIDITPSKEIGDFFDGTLDFHSKHAAARMELGYRDTLRIFRSFF